MRERVWGASSRTLWSAEGVCMPEEGVDVGFGCVPAMAVCWVCGGGVIV